MAPNVSKAPSKSLEISPIVQTLCAKDGNKDILHFRLWGAIYPLLRGVFGANFEYDLQLYKRMFINSR